MTQSTFMDKFPINSLEIQKNQTQLKTVDEVISYFKTKIDEHKIATYIAIFNHYAHTQALEGEINPKILDAKNIIFCFGAAIPNTQILAVRPRSIGIAEKKDSFVIEFMDAPKAPLTQVMQEWTKAIVTK